jgi:transposase InsO family protein
MTVYPFIEAEKVAARNVRRACELLEVSRSAYYQQRDSSPSKRETEEAELAAAIVRLHEASKGVYGAPKIHDDLKDEGRRHGRKRVARIMREHGLRGTTQKRFKTTTVPDPAAAARADLIKRDFSVDASTVNTRWCGDITYIPTWQGWLYLATVIDIASRRVVGFAMADHMRTELISDALTNALAARDPEPGVIFHSDRGSTYTSHEFAELAGIHGVRLSVGRTGSCWDNALAESWFGSLKTECLNLRTWPTRAAARAAIVDYISWFNSTRKHYTLGYLTPNQYEQQARSISPALKAVA